VDTLPHFRKTIQEAGLESHVVALVGASADLAAIWGRDLGLVFIDGGHTMRAAMNDWRAWAGRLAPGGVLAIHDVIPRPDEGGRPPMEIYRRALASGLFDPLRRVGTLNLLRRV